MVLYVIGIILCCIGGGCLGVWMNQTENTPLLITGIIIIVIGLVVTVIGSYLGKKKVKPERTTFEVEYNGDNAEQIIQKVLNDYGFKPFHYADEDVYRLGNGFWTARKLLRYTILDKKIVIVAWIAMGMGSRPNQELPLDTAFLACIPKKKLRKVVEEVIEAIKKVNSEVVQLDPVVEAPEVTPVAEEVEAPVVEEVETSEEAPVTKEAEQKSE